MPIVSFSETVNLLFILNFWTVFEYLFLKISSDLTVIYIFVKKIKSNNPIKNILIKYLNTIAVVCQAEDPGSIPGLAIPHTTSRQEKVEK